MLSLQQPAVLHNLRETLHRQAPALFPYKAADQEIRKSISGLDLFSLCLNEDAINNFSIYYLVNYAIQYYNNSSGL